MGSTSQSKMRHNSREIRAPRGNQLSAKSWLSEAPLRMLMNNLDPDVAENPHELVVYGGIGRAARTWADFDQIVEELKNLDAEFKDNQSLINLLPVVKLNGEELPG